MTRVRLTVLSLAMLVIGSPGCAERQKMIATRMNEFASMPFRFVNLGENSLVVFEGDRPVLAYNVGPIEAQKGAATRPSEPHVDYIHPLYGLDGEVLTDDFPADHVHHRGLYWAWPHVKVGGEGGQQYDLWSLRGIKVRLLNVKLGPITRESAGLTASNGWFDGDKQVMREDVRLVVHAAGGDARAIDVALTFSPTDRPVTLSGAEGKSYGGLALRFGPRKTTVITTPTTRATTAREDLLVARLPWGDFSGDMAGGGKISGAAVFVAPDHPDYPPTWMTRNYGMLAVGWPGVTARTIAPGESVTLRYRVWTHRGSPSAVEINKAYEQYCTEATREPTTVP